MQEERTGVGLGILSGKSIPQSAYLAMMAVLSSHSIITSESDAPCANVMVMFDHLGRLRSN